MVLLQTETLKEDAPGCRPQLEQCQGQLRLHQEREAQVRAVMEQHDKEHQQEEALLLGENQKPMPQLTQLLAPRGPSMSSEEKGAEAEGTSTPRNKVAALTNNEVVFRHGFNLGFKACKTSTDNDHAPTADPTAAPTVDPTAAPTVDPTTAPTAASPPKAAPIILNTDTARCATRADLKLWDEYKAGTMEKSMNGTTIGFMSGCMGVDLHEKLSVVAEDNCPDDLSTGSLMQWSHTGYPFCDTGWSLTGSTTAVNHCRAGNRKGEVKKQIENFCNHYLRIDYGVRLGKNYSKACSGGKCVSSMLLKVTASPNEHPLS